MSLPHQKFLSNYSSDHKYLNLCKGVKQMMAISKFHLKRKISMKPQFLQWMERRKRIGLQYSHFSNIWLKESANKRDGLDYEHFFLSLISIDKNKHQNVSKKRDNNNNDNTYLVNVENSFVTPPKKNLKNANKIRRKRILVWTIKCIQHQL